MRTRQRVLVLLFVAYWLVAFIVCAQQATGGSNGDAGVILQILVPVVAGGVTALAGGRKALASLWGALIGILDFNVLVAISNAHLPPSAARQPAAVILLISIPVFGSIGAVLGFAGALASRLLRRDSAEYLRLQHRD